MIGTATAAQPSYAWAFDRGDGLSNVGYGELLDAGTDDRPTAALLLDQLERLLPGSDRRRRRLGGAPPAAVRLAAGAARRPGAAGRRRRRAGQPDDRRGHLLRRRHRVAAGRAAAAGPPRPARPRRRAGDYAPRPSAPLLGRHLQAHLDRRPARRVRRAVVDAGIRAAGRDQRVFDDLVELGLGDGRITPRLAARPGRPALAPSDARTRPHAVRKEPR